MIRNTCFKVLSFCTIAIAAAIVLSGCSSARVVSDEVIATPVSGSPVVVYVADFSLDPNVVQSEGLLSQAPAHVRNERRKANGLIDLMGDTIVLDLGGKGVRAQRLPAGAPLPPDGWLVRGSFELVDDGNRVDRAMVGFGAGHTDLRVAVEIDQLSLERSGTPLSESETAARSGIVPGAAVTLNPYVGAAKFVLSGKDLEHDVKNTAAEIADNIISKTR